MPAALVKAARAHEFPLFEVPYELPFIAITERAFARLLEERYELLQRNVAGDVLAEALTGHLYPEDVQARLRAVRHRHARGRARLPHPGPARWRPRASNGSSSGEGVPSLVAIRAGLVCAVVDASPAADARCSHRSSWRARSAAELRGALRRGRARPRAGSARPRACA